MRAPLAQAQCSRGAALSANMDMLEPHGSHMATIVFRYQFLSQVY